MPTIATLSFVAATVPLAHNGSPLGTSEKFAGVMVLSVDALVQA
jgi:hypothetical protein